MWKKMQERQEASQGQHISCVRPDEHLRRNTDIKFIVVTIHGQESDGANLLALTRRLKTEDVEGVMYINMRYPRLGTFVNCFKFSRQVVTKLVASELESICLKHPGWKVYVVAHSNGTRAVVNAIVKSRKRKKFPRFSIDRLVLLGSVVKRGFKWSKYHDISVVNFVSSNDFIVLAARLFYGMGCSGKKGFKKESSNLEQIYTMHGHSRFLENYEMIRDAVFGYKIEEGGEYG
jgi:hypothetical protein